MSFFSMLADPILGSVIIRALIVGALVSVCAALLGVNLVLKRYSMIGDGLSHVGFFALAVSSAFAFAGEVSLEISIVIVLAAAFLIQKLSDNGKMGGDAAIALFSTGAVAVGVIIYDFTTGMTTDVCANMFGSSSVITLNNKDLIISVVLSAVVISLFVLFYNRIFSYTLDEDFAAATGIKVTLYKTLISLLVSVTVVLGMKMMGAIMISALVIFPALTAMRVCRSFKGVVICSAGVSLFCFILGFIIACTASLQTGPAVICVNIIAFLIFSIIGRIINGKR